MLGPDEGVYERLAEWVYQEKDLANFPEYGAGIYFTTRSIIDPSVFLMRYGLDSLLAVRLTSSIYGLLSLVVFALLVTNLFRIRGFLRVDGKISLPAIATISVYAFLPSNFLWSILGLRESASIFWTLLGIFSLLRMIDNLVKRNSKWVFATGVWSITLVLSLTASHGARHQFADFATLFLFIPISLLFLKKAGPFPILVVSLTFFTGSFFTHTPEELSARKPSAIESQAPVPGESQAPVPGESQAPVPGESQDIVRSSFLDVATNGLNRLSPTNLFNTLEMKQDGNRVGANTALADYSCEKYIGEILKVSLCQIGQLSSDFFSVVFRPLLILDSGTLNQALAGVENLLWACFVLAGILATRSLVKQQEFRLVAIPISLYTLGFFCLSSLYQGNLGTAFRHKSSVLWCLILLIGLHMLTSNLKEKKEQE